MVYITFNTPIGPMFASANDNALHYLGFEAQHSNLWAPGENAILNSLRIELTAYFAGNLKEFNTPLHLEGTNFQKAVWQSLRVIPYGQTISYKQQAEFLHKPTAYRAVANANGANQFAILIPCHRVIASQGTLGGYRGGVERKQWLLAHEAKT